MTIDGKIKAVIFDMDGTLVDSMGVWKKIDIKFLSDRNLPVSDYSPKDVEGISMAQTADYFIEKYGLLESRDELIEIWNNMAYNEYRYNISLKKAAKSLLEDLYKKGYKMAVATSNSKKLIDACFESHNLNHFFSVVVTSDDVINGKPEPDVFLEAAKRLGVSPKNCIVFEDVIHGITAANAANMTSVAVWDDCSKNDWDLKKQEADYFIKDFTEVKVL